MGDVAEKFLMVPQMRRLSPLRSFDAEALTVEVVFSVGSRVLHYDWWEGEYFYEELDMSEGAVDLTRLNNGANLLDTHRRGSLNNVIGVVERAWLEKGQGLAKVRFSRREDVQPIVLDVADGIVRNVSVGYSVLEMRENGFDPDTGYKRMLVTRWQPFEISFVPVPADGDAQARSEDEKAPRTVRCRALMQDQARQLPASAAAATTEIGENETRATETRVTETTAVPPAKPAITRGVPLMEVNENAQAGEPAETQVDYAKVDPVQEAVRRRKAIENMARANGISDARTIEHWIQSGKDWDKIADDMLKIRAENSKGVGFLDMPAKDVAKYSLWRAMNAVMSGDWTQAGRELEASQEIAKKSGRMSSAKGFFVPLDVQERRFGLPEAVVRNLPPYMQRDLTVASASGGGYLVGTDNVSFIELLRNRMVAMRMGATRLPGLVGNLTIPKQTAGATAYWLGNEATAITEGSLTFGQVALSPKTVGAYVEVSRHLMLQSSPAVESIVTSDISQQVALAGDKAVLHGSGSGGEPTGISATGSIGAFTGTSLDYAKVLDAQSDVATANVMPQRGGYVTTPAVAALLMARQRFSSTDTPLWDGNVWEGRMAGFPAMSSNQMNSACAIFGAWEQVVVGEWGLLEVALNEQANFPMGVVGFRAFYTMDVAVRYAGAFSYASSIT